MAKSSRELLITLGAETTSFAKQIKRANDLTKELDSNFKLLSSSNKNYENTLKGVGDKQDYLTERIQIFNKKSDAYVNKIKEQQEILNNVTKDQILYTRQQDAMSKALDKLKGTDAYKTLSDQLEIVRQKLEKANKEVNSHTDSIISLNKQYNDTQREIQSMTNELHELDNRLENIKSNNAFDAITQDIKETQRQFDNIKSSTINFGTTMKDLVSIQNHYQSQLEKSNSLLSLYGKEIDKSKSKIDQMENYVEELTRELRDCENTLNGMKSTDDGFQRMTTKVEKLRVELTGANNILNNHKDRLQDVTNKYKLTENEIASLSGKAVKASKDIEKMSNSVTVEKLQKEVKYLNDVSLENLSNKLSTLKADFETNSATTNKYSGSMEGLGNRVKALSEMLSVCKKSTKLYTEQLDALEKQSKEIRTEIGKVEKSLDYYKKKLDSLKEGDKKWDETNTKIKNLNETHKQLVTQLTNIEKKTTKSQQGFKAITQETTRLTASINKTKQEMKSLDDSLVFKKPKEEVKEFANVVLENLNKKLSETKQEFDKVSNGAVSLDSSMEGLGTKVKFYNTIMEQTSKVIKEYEKETQDVVTKNKELAKELDKVQKKILEIENTRSKNTGTKEWDKQVEKLGKLNTKFDELTLEIEKNNNKITENENKLKSLSSEYQKLEVNVEKTKTKMKTMTDGVKIESVKQEISYFNDYTIKKLSSSLDTAKQDFKELSSGIINIEDDMEGLTFKVKLLEDIIDKTNSTMGAYDAQIKSLVYDQKRIKSEIESTEKTLREYKESLSSLEGTEQWSIQKNKITELNNKHKELVSELTFVENKLKSSKLAYDGLNSELTSLSVNVDKTKEKMQQMKDAVNFKPVEKEIKSLSEQAVTRLKNDISKLNSSLETLDAQTSENSNSVHVLTAKSKLLNQVLSKTKELEKEYSNELKNTSSEIKRLTSESTRLENKLKKQEQLLKSDTLRGDAWTKQKEEFDKLSRKYDEVNKELTELTTKQKQLQSENNQTTNSIKNLNLQLDRLDDNLQEVKRNDSFKKIKTEMSNLEHQTEMLGSKMELLKSKYVNFETSISGAIRESKLLKEQTEKLKEQFDKQQSAISKYESRLQELITKKTELKQKIDETKNALKDMDANSPTFARTTNELAELGSNLNKVETEVEEVTNELRQLELQSNSTLTSINTNIQGQHRTWDALSGRIKTVGSTITNLGGKIQSIGGMLTPLTAGFTALSAGIIKTGMDFDAQITRLGALSGESGEKLTQVLAELEQGARDLGKTTQYSATEAAQGLEDFMLAGYDATNAIKGMPIAVQMATADNIALSDATELLTTSLSSLGDNSELTGDQIKDLDILANQLAVNAVATSTDMAGLARSLVKVGGQAENMKIPLSTTNTMLGILGDKGVVAEEAGNALSSILINLTQSTGQSAKAMEELGLSAFDADGNIKPIEQTLGELKKKLESFDTDKQEIILENMLGGKTQAKTLQKLLQGIDADTGGFTERYKQLKEELENAPNIGALEQMYKKSQDTLKYDVYTFKSVLEEMFLTVFDGIELDLRKIVQTSTELIRDLTSDGTLKNALSSIFEVVQKGIDTFKNLSPTMQENIIKFMTWGAILAPIITIAGGVISGVGSMISGFGSLVGVSGKVITKFGLLKSKGVTLKGFFTNFTGTIKTVASVFGGNLTTKLSNVLRLFGGGTGLSGVIGTLTSFVLPAIALALAGIGVVMGDNEKSLTDLIDKFGWFGEVLSGLSEFLNGVFKTTFGQAGNIFGGIGKTIGAIFTGEFGEIDDIWSETFSKMKTTASESWENITMTSTRSISKLRKYTSKDVAEIKTIFEDTYGQISQVTSTNLENVAQNITNMFADSRGKSLSLSSETIDILRGTSDTMRILFAGVKSEMDIDVAKARFTENLNNLLNTGSTTADELAKDFEKAWSTIDANILDGGQRIQKNASEVLDEFNEIATGKIDQGVNDIVSILDDLDVRGIESLRGIGTNWNSIFQGISTDNKMTTEEMKNAILKNIENLGLDTPEKLESFKNALKTELDLAKTQTNEDGQEIGEELLDGLETGVTEGSESTGETIKDTTKNITENATIGAKEGFAQLPESVREELAKAGVTINEQGNVIVEDMADKGKKGAEAYINEMNANLPKLSGVAGTIQQQLNGINSVRFGGVTKQLSQIDKWLGTVKKSAVLTGASLAEITTVSFGSTTKGLSEIDKWLSKNVTKSAKGTKDALADIKTVTFGSTTKGLSEVNKWLKDEVSPKAKTAKSDLQSLANVRFGGLTSSLSSVVNMLNNIANKANSTKNAINKVITSNARSILQEPVEIATTVATPDFSTFTNTTADISRFKTNGGFYNPTPMNTTTARSSVGTGIDDIDVLLRATLEQNQLLLQLLNQSRPLEVAVNMDGRQVAKASAKYMESEINLINSRKNRLGGK